MNNWLLALARGLRFAWMQIGLTLLLFLLLDVIASIVFSFRSEADPRAHADAYHNAPWTSDYFEEYTTEKLRWQPYAYWIGHKYSGKYINIEASGFRRTYSRKNGLDCKNPARVFTAGGSTMWGEGARDDETIASWLQKMLDDEKVCARVTNLAQIGYVSTQEVLLLAEQLRSGNVPDLVVFYDGYNDVFAAEDNGVAGLTYNEQARGKEFNLFNDRHRLYFYAARKFLMTSGLGELAKWVVTKFAPNSYEEVQGRLIRRGEDKRKAAGVTNDAKLQESVAQAYLLNKTFADAMASKFGFQTLSYLQPCLLDKNRLSAYEQSERANEIYPGESEFYRGAYGRIQAAASQAHIHDLTGLFHDTPEPYFIDESHVSGEANRIIAKAMIADIVAGLKNRTTIATKP